MASDYGLNFGFRRSDESNATREGRYKTPASGSALLLGAAVMIDSANPGRLKKAGANQAAIRGFTGILVQEESHLPSIFGAPGPGLGHDSIDLGAAKLDQLSVMWGGPSKIWVRNTPAYARGSRSKAAVSLFTPTTVTVGDSLGWDGSKWLHVDGTTITKAWMTVTLLDTSVSGSEYFEAVLNF